MIIFWILAILAGLAGVIQNGVTRKLSEKAGLASALHISNLVVLTGGLIILTLIASLSKSDFAQLLKIRLSYQSWSWWFIVPGLMGLYFITIAPFVILKIGALNVFVAIILGQIVGSVFWDHYFEGIPLDIWRVIGCLFAVLGAGAVAMSKSAAAT